MELFKTRYKRFRKPPIDDHLLLHLFEPPQPTTYDETGNPVEQPQYPYVRAEGEDMILEVATGKKFYNMDLDIIEERLWNGFYCAPQQFLRDIKMIYLDSQTSGDRERIIKASEMLASTQMTVDDIAAADPQFYEKCKNLYAKYRELVKSRSAEKGNDAPKELPGPEPMRLDDEDEDLLNDTAAIIEAPKEEVQNGIQTENNKPVEEQEQKDSVEKAQVNETSETNDGNLVAEPDTSMTEVGAEPEVPAQAPAEIPTEAIAEVPKEENLPELILDESAVKAFGDNVVDFCTKESLVLEELEQLNAAIVDTVWKNRSSWDRNAVLQSVQDKFNEVKQIYQG